MSASPHGRRYGYASSRQLSDVVDGYIYAGIPLETLVTDSQYMDNDQDFTFSKDFPVDSMQARGRPQIIPQIQVQGVYRVMGQRTCRSLTRSTWTATRTSPPPRASRRNPRRRVRGPRLSAALGSCSGVLSGFNQRVLQLRDAHCCAAVTV